jgi:trans-aconitate methyltransferase
MNQVWDPQQYQAQGYFVPTLGEPLLEMLSPKPGMRILDVGCGDGTLTLKLQAAGATVLGIDASLDMVETARQQGLDVMLLDAHEMGFDSEFEGVFSNAALHWMVRNPRQVVQNIYRALKQGGRFVAEFGGQGNIATIRRCMGQALQPYGLDLETVSPKFFPSVAEYQAMLEDAGFQVETITCFERRTKLPYGLSGWLRVFGKGTLEALPEGKIEEFIHAVESCAQDTLQDSAGDWWGDYNRLRLLAQKPLK